MATITLYANKVNKMSDLLSDAKKAVKNYKTDLISLKNKVISIDRNVCNVDNIINELQSSAQTQEQKITSLENFKKKSDEFISDAVRADNEVAEVVEESKDKFYEKFPYLKPECEKDWKEKAKDWFVSVGEFCKKHWKAIVTAVLVIAAIVCLFIPGVNAWVLGLACGKLILAMASGVLIGVISGGLLGGLSSIAEGGSFWEGFENGAFSGAICGAIFGGLSGLGQLFGGSCQIIEALGGIEKVFKVVSVTAKISGVLTAVMGGFDILALGIKLFDPSNPLVMFNKQLHSNSIYNAFQFTVSAIAAFSGGAYLRMKQGPPACFVAGTMILTAAGLVAIETIKAGDKVISTNAETFETAEKTVVETYIREVPQLVHLTVNKEIISTTVDHPFYVKNTGFVKAVELKIGDEVINSSGEVYKIENIRLEITEKPTTVYNFQVEDFHTYHVGNAGILVHNADYRNANIKDFEVKDKHLSNSTARRARKFNVSTPEDANLIVQDALKNGKIVKLLDNGIGTQGQKSFSAIIDTGKVIGVKGETCIKIVYDEFNNVWTTYPVPTP